MKASRGPLAVRRLARLLLALYPPAFRRRYHRDFLAAVDHRWEREQVASGSDLRATARTGLLLLADTAHGAPEAWRKRGGSPLPAPPGHPGSDGDANVITWLRSTVGDLRLAWRACRRQPVSTLLIVLTLGLGLGAATATFSALDRVILRPLPFPGGARMAYVALLIPERGWQVGPSSAHVQRWRAGATTVERVEIYRQTSMVRTGHGPAEILTAHVMSGGLPGMLGVRPLLGRMLGPADGPPGAARAVMLSESYWRSAFGGDPGAIGEAVTLSDASATIVGIWPDDARFDYQGTRDVLAIADPKDEIPEGDFALVLARLAPGVQGDDVERELEALSAGIEGVRAGMVPRLTPAHGFVGSRYLGAVWLIFAGAGILLLVAVLNAANLLLTRTAGRSSEIGVRMALGGSTARILRLLLAESVAVTAAGTLAGLALAWAIGQAYIAWSPERQLATGSWLHGRALVFTLAASVLAAAIAACVSAWRVRAMGVRDVLAGGAGQRATADASRVRAVLVGVQAMLAVLLVSGAALMARSYGNVLAIDPGFEAEQLAVLSIRPPSRLETSDAERAFLLEVQEAFASIPGVTGVTTASAPPFSSSISGGLPYLDDEPEPEDSTQASTQVHSVPPEYFRVLGIPIVRGRTFRSYDENDAVIVNESFARSRGGDVIGRRLRFRQDTGARTIVGVAGDVRNGQLTDDPGVQLYYAGGELDDGYTRFILRVDGALDGVVPTARARLAEIDPRVPLLEARTGGEMLARLTARHRFVAFLLAGLSGLGLAFAVSGVYGIVALDVYRRLREIGVRLALGATGGRIAALVTHRGLRPVLIGGLVGAAAAVLAGPYLEALLYDVPARDPVSVLAGLAIVVAAAALGCLIPANRAARIDPAVTLRTP